jgi:hypothetical protein
MGEEVQLVYYSNQMIKFIVQKSRSNGNCIFPGSSLPHYTTPRYEQRYDIWTLALLIGITGEIVTWESYHISFPEFKYFISINQTQ